MRALDLDGREHGATLDLAGCTCPAGLGFFPLTAVLRGLVQAWPKATAQRREAAFTGFSQNVTLAANETTMA